MRHVQAVNRLAHELELGTLCDEAEEALKFLLKNAVGVEDMANYVIAEIDDGPLYAWAEAFEHGDAEDERLFDGEEFAYEAAHAVLGLEVEWPEGYLESEDVNDDGI